VAGKKAIIEFLRYNTRATIFSRSMPIAQVVTVLENLKLARTEPFRRKKTWANTHKFQKDLRALGIYIGNTESPITPIKVLGDGHLAEKMIFALREEGILTYIVGFLSLKKVIF